MSSKFLIALIAQDLNALFSRSDANVIIVRFLNYCGGYNPGYSGCSDDDLLIVVDNQYGLDTALALQTNAVLWFHKFGHSQTLSHHYDDRNLMNATVTAANMRLTASQCNHLMSTNAVFRSLVGGIAETITQVQLATENLSPLEVLLSGAWNEGIPVEDLRRLTDSPPDLQKVLLNPERVQLWPNAVLGLGMIGDENDMNFLIWYYDFLASFEENVGAETARTNAQAKGREPTVDQIRDYLVERLVPPSWIKVATGDRRELDGVNLRDPSEPTRHVITVQALREGWDCPSAYVLCATQKLRSATAVEQLLGRLPSADCLVATGGYDAGLVAKSAKRQRMKMCISTGEPQEVYILDYIWRYRRNYTEFMSVG